MIFHENLMILFHLKYNYDPKRAFLARYWFCTNKSKSKVYICVVNSQP